MLGSTKKTFSPIPPPANNNSAKKRSKEGRFPVNPGITGFVAATGETINIHNAYEDDRFDPTVKYNVASRLIK